MFSETLGFEQWSVHELLFAFVCLHEFWFHEGNLYVAYCVQDIEATIHCAEWLSIVGGSSTGEQRLR